jgi:hypothetical protein
MLVTPVLLAGLVFQAPVCPDAAVAAHLKSLTAAYDEMKAGPIAQEGARRFLEALPRSFPCFYALFGYPNDKPGPLYSEPELHSLFPRLAAALPPAELTKRIVELSVRAHWEADQTGALQEASRALLDQHSSLYVNELRRLSKEEEVSVWRFLFDGPHPSNLTLSADVRRAVCSLSQRSCASLDRVYVKALAREKREH